MSVKKSTSSKKGKREKRTVGKATEEKRTQYEIKEKVPQLFNAYQNLQHLSLLPSWTVEEKNKINEILDLLSDTMYSLGRKEDPLEAKFLLMETPDYKDILISEEEKEEYEKKGWKVITREFYTNEEVPVITKRMVIEGEKRIRNLFNFLKSIYLIHPANYDKYSWNDFYSEFLQGDHQYDLITIISAEGLLIPYLWWNKKDLHWEKDRQGWTEGFEYLSIRPGEDVKQSYDQFADISFYKAELREGKKLDWVPLKMLYFDFKTNKAQILELSQKDEIIISELK